MKVSIIIPCYNVENYIIECLQSIEQQEHKDVEIICVNDGSKDNTLKAIQQFQKASTLLINTIEQENAGAPSARNKGLQSATGEYVQFLDADDLLLPHKLSQQLKIAQNHNLPQLIIGSYRRISVDGQEVDKRQYKNSEHKTSIWRQLMRTDLGITSSNLFLRRVFEEGLHWNEDLKSSQEYELMFQLLKQYNHIAFDENVSTTIRNRPSGSISQMNRKQKWEQYATLRVQMYQHAKSLVPIEIKEQLQMDLFDALRLLYPHNAPLAVQYHKTNIPKSFRIQPTSITSSGYRRLYQVFGFKFTERMKRLIKSSPH